ncbi:hypothetical protein A2673_03000 [Candidatus Kaiserbacteria bacterium RIFCSPHIGHO2_01_FULL_50_13]|uniref:Type II secretion system protein J n=1 Tax=Candidatus Kaiserbacteria bacterium RIFCSPLOWO2_01_FULL_50_24 TaxID=1798507 RepID=A0A1F6ERW5_9BACT|nr:MAG: hypothetical protein A2673_03000 [Candidatus Kaiserbacteria bacterium RIFCSPHIGHO2_01_FULL_50_13]OGG76192.1 MAG: hypothetical protein A3A34_01735 [Candidatus Kaiserbacteria bacterium RIFCSPLOWO2_01_FULL_50_24]
MNRGFFAMSFVRQHREPCYERCRGLTLIETLVWIAVFTAAMIAIVTTLLYFYKTNRYAIEQATAVSSAQRGLEQTVRVIRESAYSSQGAFPIHSIAENDFVFYADVDTDALIERVHYYLDETNLMRGIVKATGNPPDYTEPETVSVLADNVRNVAQDIVTFRYFDELGSEITNYDNWTAVRFVVVTLVVNVNETALPNELTLQSSASIRNLAGK